MIYLLIIPNSKKYIRWACCKTDCNTPFFHALACHFSQSLPDTRWLYFRKFTRLEHDHFLVGVSRKKRQLTGSEHWPCNLPPA